MSSTNRGAVRDIDDHYATPPEVTLLICKALRDDGWVEDPVVLLEPGCGEGSFLTAFRKVWPEAQAVGIDINQELVDIAVERGYEAYRCNWLSRKSRARLANTLSPDEESDELGDFNAIIGNPPFVKAQEFISRALKHCDPDGCVAFILRLNFLGGKERFQTFWNNPDLGGRLAHFYVMPLRVGFTANGRADSIEYGVFIFKPRHEGGTSMSFLDNLSIQNKWRGEQWHWRRKKEVPDGELPA